MNKAMKIQTSDGPKEVEGTEIAPGLFVTPWFDKGGVSPGWTVSVRTGYCLSHAPLCRKKAIAYAKALSELGDWDKDISKYSDLMIASIDIERFRALRLAAEQAPFCDSEEEA